MPLTLTTSDYSTVTDTSQEMTAMIAGNSYRLVSSVNAYFKIGVTASVTASAANDSHFLPAGVPISISAKGTATVVAIIRESVDGVATLSKIEPGSLT